MNTATLRLLPCCWIDIIQPPESRKAVFIAAPSIKLDGMTDYN